LVEFLDRFNQIRQVIMYVTLTNKEKDAFLNSTDNRTYKYVGHSFTPLKGAGKQVCKSCGLMLLRNQITDWCVSHGCFHDVHPQYKNKLKKLAGGMNPKAVK
jgi:ribosomal protein L32